MLHITETDSNARDAAADKIHECDSYPSVPRLKGTEQTPKSLKGNPLKRRVTVIIQQQNRQKHNAAETSCMSSWAGPIIFPTREEMELDEMLPKR